MKSHKYMFLGIFLMVSAPYGSYYGLGLPMIISSISIFFFGFIYSVLEK